MTSADSRGFTMLELVVALALSLIGFAALIPGAIVLAKANRAAGARTTALSMAQKRLEELASTPYDEVISMSPWSTPLPSGFTESVAFLPVSAHQGYEGDLLRILVTVSWTDQTETAGRVDLVLAKSRW